MWKYREIFFTAFLIAIALVPFLRALAFRFKILDHPKKHGIHSHPVPRIGGAAIYLAFVIAALYRFDLSPMLKGVLVGSSVIFAVGLWDDLFHLRASLKLAIQLVACAVMMFHFGVMLHVFPWLLVNIFFTVLGIIGLTNAVNFLDNMDGLSSGLVMISSTAISLVAFNTNQPWLGYLSSALAGACAGFLIFNLRPAYIFMGDAGSTFLGFTLASLCVMTEWSYEQSVTLAAPLLILGVPILDMFLITALRFKENKIKNFREWIDYTGKDHLSHRVMRLGLGKRGAVFALWTLQTVFCAVALFILPRHAAAGYAGIAFFLLFTASVIVFFRRRRRIVLAIRRGWKVRKKKNKGRRAFPALLLAGFTLLSVFGIAEISYRLYVAVRKPLYRPSSAPGLGWELTPGAVKKAPVSESGTLVYRINDLGFRDKTGGPWEKWKDPALKIAFLGDSVTFGPEVEAEKIFAFSTGEKLSRLTGIPVRPLNAGVEATNTRQQAALLEHKLLKLGPDLVILDYFPNDIEQRAIEKIPPALNALLSRSSFLTFFSNRLITWLRNYRLQKSGNLNPHAPVPANRPCPAYNEGLIRLHENAAEWSRMKGLLARIVQRAGEKKVLLALVYFPFEEEVRGLCPAAARQKLEAFAASEKIPFFDMTAGLAAEGHLVRAFYVEDDNIHLSGAGHEKAATALANWLAAEPAFSGLLAKKKSGVSL